MAFFGLFGDNRQMAATTYSGRESAGDRKARKGAAASARRRAAAKRSVSRDAVSGGGEAFADRNARSTTGWFRRAR
ncbi:hypothetical protein ABZ502_17725 [Streptomyces abikoensis]|uniref:hypothetical protein n=1 Tax=Streptomyces abikoensis TaxID=97398 RepID=UPI00340E27D6